MAEQKEDWEPHINVINNDIWYTGNITLIGVSDLIKVIQECINIKHVDQEIHLYISSSGGCITSAMMLYNYLNNNYKSIVIIGTSRLCSSATYMLFTRCLTYVYPNIYVLFHPMNFEYSDNQQAVSRRSSLYKHLIKSVNDIYLRKNFKCNWTSQDSYLFSEDLISKGIVDALWKTY